MAEKPQKPKKVMVCCECGEEDDSWTAYCGRCGRSLHKIVENSQKPIDTAITEVLNKVARDNGCKDWEDLDENGVFQDIEDAVKLAFITGSEWGKLEGAKAEKERILKFMDSIAMGSPEEDLKQYWKLGEKLKKEVNPDA